MQKRQNTGIFSTITNSFRKMKSTTKEACSSTKKAMRDLPDLPWRRLPKEGYFLLIIAALLLIGLLLLSLKFV